MVHSNKKQRPAILSWNIRGINNSIARRNLRNLISANLPAVIFVQETKSADICDVLRDSIWDLNSHGWIISPSSGLSGGLLTSWDKNTITLVSSKICHN